MGLNEQFFPTYEKEALMGEDGGKVVAFPQKTMDISPEPLNENALRAYAEKHEIGELYQDHVPIHVGARLAELSQLQQEIHDALETYDLDEDSVGGRGVRQDLLQQALVDVLRIASHRHQTASAELIGLWQEPVQHA